MLSRVLRRLTRPSVSSRVTRRPQLRLLGFEPLEAREVPAIVYGLTTANALLRFDASVPTLVNTIPITGLQSNTEHVVGIDFRPRTGQFYATTAPTGVTTSATLNTYTINPLTGAATF